MFRAVRIIFLISAIFIINGCGGKKYSEYKVYSIPQSMEIEAGKESFLTLQVEIPSSSHIYGNPKGPGTGKATEVFSVSTDEIVFSQARYLPPKKFYTPLEKEFTWGYSGETKIFIPVKADKKAISGDYKKYNIKLDALLCTDSACIPKIIKLEYLIKVIKPGEKGTVISNDLLKLYEKSSPPSNIINIEKKQSAENEDVSKKLEGENFNPEFTSSNVTGLLQAILFGLLAGFILNFMPCVLPVVSLKVMSFVQSAGKSRKALILLGLFFSAGIITSFTVLASLAAFFGYNWGGLFQNRPFLIVMTLLVFAMALSMFEVFTINTPGFAGNLSKKQSNQYAEAYAKGLFATLLTTPCSGPFLGGTLSWALSQPPLIIFIIFISIGIGMSLPYLALTLNPKLLKFLPKPGNWLSVFEKIMAFLLIFTVVYLLSIFDKESILPMILLLSVAALGFWQYGKFGSVINNRNKRFVSLFALILIITGGYFLSFHYFFKIENVQITKNEFSVEKLYSNRNNKVTVVKWTADWCPNCTLVEKLSLNTSNVSKVLNENNIEILTADITRKSPDAEKLLELLGNRSIPFLAVFPKGEAFNTPICLRDVYSEKDVIDAINNALKR
jgi:thiol:disulfide interchange protein DsbD